MTSPKPSTASKMASYFSKLSPVPAFPEYTGPYKVGTVDVEIPVSHLEGPISAPDNAADIHTIQYRVFYPAVPQSNEKRISWLPNPQRHHISSYTKFLGIRHSLAEVLSFFPQHLYYTSIPVHKNAKMEEAGTENKRWPTMIFSHGLGGSRNSYSYIAGSLASHGMVVICPEHRDGSAVASFIRLPNEKNQRHSSETRARRSVPYKKIPHTVCPEVYEAREAQLRIRMWEMGLIHQAVVAMDNGDKLFNMNTSTPSLDHFIGKMRVQEPGSIIFGGHSFGAATTVQFVKSIYYAHKPTIQQMEKPLCTPELDSAIRAQITEETPTMLLDMWCLPLLAPNSSALFDLPLPAYDEKPSAPGGNGLLAVESEAFFKWTEHLHAKARILSPDPTAKVVTADMFTKSNGKPIPRPNFYYVIGSAHLSQSDFGILFPWMTKKIFDVDEPERALRLNLRAQLQFLRWNGVPVASTAGSDLVDGVDAEEKASDGLSTDLAIFDQSGEETVDCWRWIDTVGLGEASANEDGKATGEQLAKGEKEIKGEIDPPVETAPLAPAVVQRTLSSLSVMSQQSTLREVAA